MNYAYLQAHREWMLLEAVSGSRAYGLDRPDSDTDLRGVFVLPKREFFGFGYTEQVASAGNDETYYELKRYAELLVRNNPNILELLATPDDCLRYRHPLMERFKPGMFLSRLCEQTFAGYAYSQIKKARGLNKKIVNPVEPERKSPLDFCHVAQGQGSMPLPGWLRRRGWSQEECGLAAIPHFRDGYALFHSGSLPPGDYFRGIVSGPDAQEVCLSSIPKGLEPAAIMHFNRNGYSAYCREYREYWEWVARRNEARYRDTLEHGKNYDAKNMMHTFRLLRMALEIAREGKVHVRRQDREFLLAIRCGGFGYDELVGRADELLGQIHEAYAASNLPDEPDAVVVEGLLVELRETLYVAPS